MEKSFKHSKTFRYEIHNANPHAKTVLYVLHGYGQLVKYFIRKFHQVPEDIMIVAPEGMHRFYLKGSSGRVGASWMTKEIRHVDIEDNMDLLDALDQQISRDYAVEKKYILGFSQGGSTAARWKIHSKSNFDALIVWASDFPPEEKENAHKLGGDHLYFVIGDTDEFYDEEGQQNLIESYKNLGFQAMTFKGRHDIDSETLLKILNKIHEK